MPPPDGRGPVLFIGEINVDVMMGGMESPPLVDREVIAKTYDVVMGGSTLISACAYAALGGATAYAGLCGEDEYGEFLLRGLREFGIDTKLVRRTREARTGVTVNMIHENTRSQATYPGTIAAYDGGGVAEALARFRHIHFAGVYLETALLPKIAGLLRAARERGLSTSIDTQWDSSERWEYTYEWLPELSYLFVNEHEAQSLARASSPQEACRRLAPRTACPVVKAGPEGAFLADGGAVVQVPPRRRVEPVDTTGAGDTFDAAFLYARLDRAMPPREAAEFANGAAARSCLFTGGTAARSSYEDVIAFLRG